MKKLTMTFGAAGFLTLASIAPAEQYALLVAIDDYSNVEGASSLPGCMIDLQEMKTMLVDTFGYPSANVATLTDSQATKANVVSQLDALVKKAEPGDAVVFYYSGHGSQVPDLNDDDETDDNLDEVLVTYDFDPRSQETWLLDDHLRAGLSQLKTKRALVLIDACHSGTGTRGDIINKQAKFGFETMLGRGRKDVSEVEVAKGSPDSHVLISGCAANELSAMGVYDGVKRSLFTTSLINVLPRMRSASLAEVNKALHADMESLHPSAAAEQHPQLETALSVSIDVLLGSGAGAPESVTTPNEQVPSQTPSDGLPSAFPVQVVTDKREYRAGETMVATVVSEKAGFLRLYYIDKTGDATLIFPNHYQRDNRIAGQQRIEVGGAAHPFVFRMTAPGGTEMLLAAVSEAPFDDADSFDFSKEKPMKDMGKVTSIRKLVDSGVKQIQVEGKPNTVRPAQIGRASIIYEIHE